MSTKSTIDTLRRAEARLRDAAGGGTEGQRTFDTASGQVWAHPGEPCLVATVPWVEDGALLAPMDPLVWLALADWLGVTADGLARRGVTAHVKPAEAAALTLALRVLGEEE